jgi:predicted HTH domain antitoxin
MQVELPDILIPEPKTQAPRFVLEAMVLRACGEGRIAQGKAAELLGLSFAETEHFLARHQVMLPYTLEDFQHDGVLLVGVTRS